MEGMFTLDTILILAALITEVVIFIEIYLVMSAIGKSVPVSTVRAELENISEQALIMSRGLKTLRKELESLHTGDK
jgi:hypothetical protein